MSQGCAALDRRAMSRAPPFRPTILPAELHACDDAEAATARAQQAQVAAEDRTRKVLEAARMTTWEWTGHGQCRVEGTALPAGSTGTPMDAEAFLAHVHPDDRLRVRDAVQEALVAPHPYEIEFRLQSDDGLRWYQARGDSFLDPTGVARTTGVLVDVTALKDATLAHQRLTEELERQVAERTEALATANRELEAFAWSVSHDLRAPLRAIDGFSALLEEDAGAGLDATARGYLGRIRAAAHRMGELIDDLLMLSRVTRSDLVTSEIDLTRLAEDVVAELRAKPGAGDRAVEVTIQRGMHAPGDARLVRIVMENLLANAWKFTRARAQAHVTVEQDADGTVRVLDDGVGFDVGQKHRLFVPFQRLHGPEPYEGSGIGLAIVQRIVLRHAGQVGAESRPGGGAMFWFRLGNV